MLSIYKKAENIILRKLLSVHGFTFCDALQIIIMIRIIYITQNAKLRL